MSLFSLLLASQSQQKKWGRKGKRKENTSFGKIQGTRLRKGGEVRKLVLDFLLLLLQLNNY